MGKAWSLVGQELSECEPSGCPGREEEQQLPPLCAEAQPGGRGSLPPLATFRPCVDATFPMVPDG